MKIEKIITILNYLAKRLGAIDKLKAIKLLFFIDKEHLIKYGRFVTNDTYLKLPYGPVPTRILNIIDEVENLFDGEKKYIFDNLDIDLKSNYRTMTSKKEPDLLELSKSELKVIDDIISKYGNYTGSQLIEITHKEYAYNQASELGKLSIQNLVVELPDAQKKELIEHFREEHQSNELLYEFCH